MLAADATPSDGVVQHQGTNAQRRRRAQSALLRAAWQHLYPGDAVLSLRRGECGAQHGGG